MPTHEETERFLNEYRKLRLEEQRLFDQAVAEFVAALKAHHPLPRHLGIRRFRSQKGVFEFHWAPDRRALFTYGSSPHSGDVHVIWLRIGTHDIYENG
ncbi:MAG TPA: hypothetical protein VH599_06345 [Ktedonobacterales bacterium]|jgi:hypothetical protein